MLADLTAVQHDLRSPRSGTPLTRVGDTFLGPDGTDSYSIVDGLPILVDFENSVIERPLVGHVPNSEVPRVRWRGISRLLKRIVSRPGKKTIQNMAFIHQIAKSLPITPKILIVGGALVGEGTSQFYDDPQISVIAFDVFVSCSVQFVADAHSIPLADSCIDIVIVQAVLEHVLLPERVVSEIWRVLKMGGLVYAETPFLQQVHEGAYDFTRFTESGHRFLFRKFDCINTGTCAGPATQLLWSIDYFVRSLFKSKVAGKIAKLLFFWLQYFDDFISDEHSSDGASATFFLGTKSQKELNQKEILSFYKGAQ